MIMTEHRALSLTVLYIKHEFWKFSTYPKAHIKINHDFEKKRENYDMTSCFYLAQGLILSYAFHEPRVATVHKSATNNRLTFFV